MRLLTSIRNSFAALRILYWLSGVINLFCRRFDRKANCMQRRLAGLPVHGLVNGQDRLPFSDLPYGAWRLGRNGCEAIAVYNVLQELNMPKPLEDVLEWFERKGLLFNGMGGTNLGAIKPFLKKNGLRIRIIRRSGRAGFDKAFSDADAAILAYWTGPTLRDENNRWNSLHTVSIHHLQDGASVCNVSMTGSTPVAISDIEAFLQRESGEPVCLFLVSKIG